MPIYDYQCGSCGHGFELRQGFDAETIATCPQCSAPSRRRFHAPTVIYKGSGFYTTDYKRKTVSEPSSNGNDSQTTSSSEKSDSPTEARKSEEKKGEVKTGASEGE